MSETEEARRDSSGSTEASDRKSPLSPNRRDSFDPFQYVKTWSRELHLPSDPTDGGEQEAESDSFSILYFVDKDSPESLEKQTREREELKRAKDRLGIAEKLRQDGYLLDSIIFCGPILRQEVGKWTRPVKHDNYGTILLRQCIMQLLLVFCEFTYDVLFWHREDDFPIGNSRFLTEIVGELYDTQNLALLCVLRDICGYLVIQNHRREVQHTLQNILVIMEPIYLPDDPETLLALKYLAESFVFDGYQGDSPEDSSFFAERETYIRRHSIQIRKEVGPYDPASLRYDHAMARVLLSHGKLQEAKNVLRDIFDRRETAFGETHLESQKFIDELLVDFCEDFEGTTSARYRDFSDSSVIDNLIKFCMKRKAYEEVDTLAQECVFPREDTCSASEDRLFGRWAHFKYDPIPKVQPRLASHQTPMWGWYWEDSRMYFCTWDQVTLSSEYPEDPFPRAPIRLFVSDEAISIDISRNCLADFESKPEVDVESGPAALIHNSEIWQLLESKRLSDDWKILPGPSTQNLFCEKQIEGPVDYLFWLFWDEATESRCVTTTKDTVSRPQVPYSRNYGFRNLDKTKPEWLVIDADAKSDLFFHFPKIKVRNKPKIPGTLKYHIDEPRDNRININVPFVPYEHFQSSRAYREGLTYVEYFEVLRKRASGDAENEETKIRWCKGELSGRRELPVWHLSDTAATNCRVHGGFYNGIPTGLCAIVNHASTTDCFNMVSSDWTDWKSFTLHKADIPNTPSLQLPSGEPVKCQGYITGTWTEDGQLSRQWSGLQFFIMDCSFSGPGSDQCRNFVIASGMLTEQNLHLMSGPEKRFFCGKLSISLFRYAPMPPRFGASVWMKKPKKETNGIAGATVEDSFWGEMNRREKWDRDFEKRLKVGPPSRFELSLDRREEEEFREKWFADMEAEKESEEIRRREWDARTRAGAQQQLSQSRC